MVDNNKKFTWITGGDEGYLPMIEVLAKSLLKHSNYRLIVYGFNCDSNIDLPNVTNKRIDFKTKSLPTVIDAGESDLINKDYSIYFAKYLASLNSLREAFDYYAWIDGDAFVTKHIDDTLKYTELVDDYPLFMRYFHQEINNWRKYNDIKLEGKYGSELAKIRGIKRNPNNRIIATGFYIYDKRSSGFFLKCLKWHRELNNHSIKIWVDDNAFSEERVANCILWEEGKDKYLPITWNNYYNNDEEIVNLPYYLKKGWDMMYDTNTNNVLFIHGPDPSVMPKNAKILNQTFKDHNSTKLMIVAHPDDELIFGGNELINHGSDYKVVCITNPEDKDRIIEFEIIMNKLNICAWEILDFEDTLYPTNLDGGEDDRAISTIFRLVDSRQWDKIITHNPIGEYGHPQHKWVFDRVKTSVDVSSNNNDFYVFGKSSKKLNKDKLDIKRELLTLYKSQQPIINQLLNNDGRWFISDDSTTNYIEYENITKYNENDWKNNYINCYDK